MQLFEILIPVVSNEGKVFTPWRNSAWESEVIHIANGLTKFSTIDGQWKNSSGELFVEKMIPVRIACSQKQIEEIADFTAVHYEQQAVMYYLVSENVVIKNYPR